LLFYYFIISIMKKLIELKLKILAKLILKKYNPEIIGITGSVGKTSTKEAINTVLKGKFKTRTNIKNYNNEIGLPLTIINAESPGKNIFGWFFIFLKALKLVLIKDKAYPQILVLEMGVDRPGDMDYLNSIVKCHIGVLTLVGTVHMEYFRSKNELKQEKAKLIKSLPQDGFSIINYDNQLSREAIKVSRAKTISYGLDEAAVVRAQEIRFSYEGKPEAGNIQGISFKLSHEGSFAPVLLPGALGIGAVYSSLAAAAVGIAKDMNLIEISEALKGFASPKGRMKLIKGIKDTIIIDDTYNAEPESTIAALGALRRITVKSGARRYAVLGDMLELGKYSESAHRDVGKYIAGAKIDILVVIGERSRDIARGAKAAGMNADYIFHFPYSEEAGWFLQERIITGDLILIKGSQGIRTEKAVKEIMADPLHAKVLLVRQDREWAEA